MIRVLVEDLEYDITHILFVFDGTIRFYDGDIQRTVKSSDIASANNEAEFATHATSFRKSLNNFKIRAFRYRGVHGNYGTRRATFTGQLTIYYDYGYTEVVQLTPQNQTLITKIPDISYPLEKKTVTLPKDIANKYNVSKTLTREQATYIMLIDRHNKQMLDKAEEISTEDPSRYKTVKVKVTNFDKDIVWKGTATLDTVENIILLDGRIFVYVEDEGVYCWHNTSNSVYAEIL